MKIFNKIRKISYFHYICFGITLIFLLIAVFVFPKAYLRLLESLKDFGKSFGYYIQEIFHIDFGIKPSVNNFSSVPFTPIINLPDSWQEFKTLWSAYCDKLFSEVNNL